MTHPQHKSTRCCLYNYLTKNGLRYPMNCISLIPNSSRIKVFGLQIHKGIPFGIRHKDLMDLMCKQYKAVRSTQIADVVQRTHSKGSKCWQGWRVSQTQCLPRGLGFDFRFKPSFASLNLVPWVSHQFQTWRGRCQPRTPKGLSYIKA